MVILHPYFYQGLSIKKTCETHSPSTPGPKAKSLNHRTIYRDIEGLGFRGSGLRFRV